MLAIWLEISDENLEGKWGKKNNIVLTPKGIEILTAYLSYLIKSRVRVGVKGKASNTAVSMD